MRKSLVLTAALICILILGGCANTVQETEWQPSGANESQTPELGQSSNVSEVSAATERSGVSEASGTTVAAKQDNLTSDGKELSTSVAPDPWTLTAPPELTVSTEYNADQISAQCYGYGWNVKLEGDMMTTVIACGPHPLDSSEELDYAVLYTAFPVGSLPPLEEGQLPGFMLPVYFLDFGVIPPETVTVKRWPAAYVGHTSEHSDDSEQVTVDSSDGFMLLPLGDGEFVYEVHADWGQVGSADYVFRTVPEVRAEP